MTAQDEQALRQRLHGAFDPLTPVPAPVGRVMRKGKAMRARRTVGVVGALAAAVAAGLIVPGLLSQPATRPAVPVRHSVTEFGPGKHAAAGLISYGTIDGKAWKVILSGTRSSVMIGGSGHVSFEDGSVLDPGGSPASMNFEQAPKDNVLEAGTVSKDVTSLAVSLQGGTVLDLIPVDFKGQPWVAFVLPPGVNIQRAVAYHHGRELGYSIPYRGVELDTWWDPGQVGPARQTRIISSNRLDGKQWQSTAQIGPWGYCYAFPDGSSCADSANPFPGLSSGRRLAAGFMCGPLSQVAKQGIWYALTAAAPSARQVLLRFSDGSTARLSTVEVAGTQMVAYLIPAGQRVSSAVEYDAGGLPIGTTAGTEWSCGPGA